MELIAKEQNRFQELDSHKTKGASELKNKLAFLEIYFDTVLNAISRATVI